MISKSVWRIMSTELLARVAFAILAATLGTLGLGLSSPLLSCLAAMCLMVLLYRLRYGRF